MHQLVKAIKALSDDTRIRMLNVLAQRECCVCEIVQALDISQTRASRNLSMLYEAGFLQMRKEGLWTVYSLNKDEMPDYLIKLSEAVILAMQHNKIAAQDQERLKTAVRSGSCAQKSAGMCKNRKLAS